MLNFSDLLTTRRNTFIKHQCHCYDMRNLRINTIEKLFTMPYNVTTLPSML